MSDILLGSTDMPVKIRVFALSLIPHLIHAIELTRHPASFRCLNAGGEHSKLIPSSRATSPRPRRTDSAATHPSSVPLETGPHE